MKLAPTFSAVAMSETPGGNTPRTHPQKATMLGSLMVQARAMRSCPRWLAARLQKVAKRSAVSADSQPPLAASHRGLVK